MRNKNLKSKKKMKKNTKKYKTSVNDGILEKKVFLFISESPTEIAYKLRYPNFKQLLFFERLNPSSISKVMTI